MYEDPISQVSHYGSHNRLTQQQLNMQEGQELDQDSCDQELLRLHQHRTLIQLRLEINALRTQIQQLELLKQQLIHQRQFMQPGEYEQLMDQFSRTTKSLLRVASPGYFSNNICQEQCIERIGGQDGGVRIGTSGGSGRETYVGMHVMERLQEKLRTMTIQQHQQRQHYAQKQQEPKKQQNQYDIDSNMDDQQSGASSPRRAPIEMEKMSLEAELRDLEQRMRSIQLLC
ncbi:hypothetical protein BGZ76_006549 [Entomortierella beljakovae]|nr:hypothetical protein BGZ76_006549 [Entomortierella beljakovae]